MKTLSAISALLLLSAAAPAFAQSGSAPAARSGAAVRSLPRVSRGTGRLPFGPGFASSPYGAGFGYSNGQSGFASYGRSGHGLRIYDWGRSEWDGYADGRDDRRGRHHHNDYDGYDGGYWIPTGFADGDGSGYVGTIGVRDIGFFHQRGAVHALGSGHASYDYDRGYPYDFYSERDERGDERAYAMSDKPRAHGCQSELTRDRRNGGSVEVRVCRN